MTKRRYLTLPISPSQFTALIKLTQETLGPVQEMHSGEQKILGVRWNTSTDRLCFNLEEIARVASELEPTKRHLVSIVGRFYDPMGFLSPVVIKFKMLLQALCEEKARLGPVAYWRPTTKLEHTHLRIAVESYDVPA